MVLEALCNHLRRVNSRYYLTVMCRAVTFCGVAM
jgi:hypothetical protein